MTPLLLIGSDILMTFAWYGHLARPAWPIWLGEPLRWNFLAAGLCLIATVAFIFPPVE